MSSRKRRKGRGGAREGAGRPALVPDPADLTVRFHRRDLEALAELAAARGLSVGYLVREAVGRYLKSQRRGR